MIINLPGMRLVSESNARGHWGKRYARSKPQREDALVRTLGALREQKPPLDLPLTVRITRIAPRELDDDNARAAAKAVRDGIADALKRELGLRDDRDPRVTWEYAQERARVREYAVRVEVTERDSAQKSCGELDTAHASEQSANTSAGARVRAKR